MEHFKRFGGTIIRNKCWLGDNSQKCQIKADIFEGAGSTDEQTRLGAGKESAEMLHLKYRFVRTGDLDGANGREKQFEEF